MYVCIYLLYYYNDDVNISIIFKQFGESALIVAASHDNVDVIRLLLEAGANINLQTKVYSVCVC